MSVAESDCLVHARSVEWSTDLAKTDPEVKEGSGMVIRDFLSLIAQEHRLSSL